MWGFGPKEGMKEEWNLRQKKVAENNPRNCLSDSPSAKVSLIPLLIRLPKRVAEHSESPRFVLCLWNSYFHLQWPYAAGIYTT